MNGDKWKKTGNITATLETTDFRGDHAAEISVPLPVTPSTRVGDLVEYVKRPSDHIVLRCEWTYDYNKEK